MQKHVGTLVDTGSRVFVVFRQLPNDPNMCLVVYRDSIPEIYAYAVSRFVMEDGQHTTTEDLADMMDARGIMPTGENMLTALHTKGLLVPKPTENVLMWLDEQNSIKLDVLNKNWGEANSPKKPTKEVTDFNPFDSTEATVLEDIEHQIKDMERTIEKLVQRAKMLDDTFEYHSTLVAEQPVVETNDSDDLVIRIPAADIVTMSLTKFNELTKVPFREHKKRLNG